MKLMPAVPIRAVKRINVNPPIICIISALSSKPMAFMPPSFPSLPFFIPPINLAAIVVNKSFPCIVAIISLRRCAKVALLDLNEEAAKAYAEEIVSEGGVAKAYSCNVLDKDICYQVADKVLEDLGPCDILINGAGGNNPKATTDKEYFEMGDIDAGDKESVHEFNRFSTNYTNPFVILGSCFLLLFFSRLNFRSRLINWLAAGSLSVYVVHQNLLARPVFKEAVVHLHKEFEPLLFALLTLLSLVGVYVVSVLVDQVRAWSWQGLEAAVGRAKSWRKGRREQTAEAEQPSSHQLQ